MNESSAPLLYTDTMKRLVLLGAGHAHLGVLKNFASTPLPDTEVILVSPHAQVMYSGMAPGYVAGHYPLQACQITLEPLVRAARALWVPSSAAGLQADKQRVVLANGETLDYDVLSIDIGALPDRDALPGAREYALFVRPLETFVELWQRMSAVARAKPLRVSVIGAGAAGVELAMAMKWRLRDQAVVALITGGPPPCAQYPPRMQQRVVSALRRMDITLLHERCVAIHASTLQLANGATVSCDAPIMAVGPAAPAWLRDTGLALDADGFVCVNEYQQSVSHPHVLAAGDVATRVDRAVPKSGVYAVRAAAPLANNLRLLLAGQPLQRYQPPHHTLNLLSAGDRYALASYGSWSAQGHWVWWWKYMIDRHFVRGFVR